MLRNRRINSIGVLVVLSVSVLLNCTNNVDIDEFMDDTLMAGMPVPGRDPIKLFLDHHVDHKEHEFPRPDKPKWYTCTHYSTETTKEYIVLPDFNGIDGFSLMLVAREHFPGLMEPYKFKISIDKAVEAIQKVAGRAADEEDYDEGSRSTEFIWYLGDEYVYSLKPYPRTRMIQYTLTTAH